MGDRFLVDEPAGPQDVSGWSFGEPSGGVQQDRVPALCFDRVR
jgi:hypothetical protein